jgi:uncharacterized protein
VNNLDHPLRLNVGFIVSESVGYCRVFDFALPQIQLAPDLEVKEFSGAAKFERTHRGLLLTANFSGMVHSQCVRCLDDIEQKLTTDFTELYAFSQRTMTDSELLVPDDGKIDLTPLVSEYLLLEIPHKPICKPDCAGLCPQCGANWNIETCDCKHEEIDPRLAKLKDLLDGKE